MTMGSKPDVEFILDKVTLELISLQVLQFFSLPMSSTSVLYSIIYPSPTLGYLTN